MNDSRWNKCVDDDVEQKYDKLSMAFARNILCALENVYVNMRGITAVQVYQFRLKHEMRKDR